MGRVSKLFNFGGSLVKNAKCNLKCILTTQLTDWIGVPKSDISSNSYHQITYSTRIIIRQLEINNIRQLAMREIKQTGLLQTGSSFI